MKWSMAISISIEKSTSIPILISNIEYISVHVTNTNRKLDKKRVV
jgi:hypothetical protein